MAIAIPSEPGASTQSAGVGTHWLELELVDEAEGPVIGEPYQVVLPDGRQSSGSLDQNGQVRIAGIQQPGWCRIRFTHLDVAAWQRWAPLPPKTPPPAPPASAPSAQPPTAPQPSPATNSTAAQPGQASRRPNARLVSPAVGPTDRRWRNVLQGECTSSIAKDTGHFWRTIWDHANNANLKQRRVDPNVLCAGDAVYVPDLCAKDDPGSTDQHHKFRRRGEPSFLRLVVEGPQGPRANEPYTLIVDGREFSGVTDAKGKIEQAIPGNARHGELRVGPPDNQKVYLLQLGHLDPLETIAGVQARLNNLGFKCGPVNNELQDGTRAGISAFQAANGLSATGEPDAATLAKLLNRHGS